MTDAAAPKFPSVSQRRLASLLNGAGGTELRKRLADRGVHRTQLWKYATGQRQPEITPATYIHNETDGEVAATGWVVAKRKVA
jgi:hypothetical protein